MSTDTRTLCRALWQLLVSHPGIEWGVSTEAVRVLLTWNDANGDYTTLDRRGLLAALRIQLDGGAKP